MHPGCESGEHVSPLVDREPNNQNPALGLCEQFAQDHPCVACRAEDVGAARHHLDGGIATPSILRRQRVEQQRGMLCSQTGRQ
jgi:hypothetical protein